MMKHLKFILIVCVVLASSGAVAEMNDSPSQSQPAATGQAARTESGKAQSTDRGQQVFNQHCSRCHNAPDKFSTRISGTIVRHMRVRANLSEADYRALLKFLNP
jgi:cytochrome c5